jgi:acetyl-CoA carboxylase biotin carboxyl carrier protein
LAEIRSPITGSVFKLIAAAGDDVAVDQLVALIESMKLEIVVESEVAGTIRAVRVAEGDAIAEGDVMFDVD